jgi:hypothetical protein
LGRENSPSAGKGYSLGRFLNFGTPLYPKKKKEKKSFCRENESDEKKTDEVKLNHLVPVTYLGSTWCEFTNMSVLCVFWAIVVFVLCFLFSFFVLLTNKKTKNIRTVELKKITQHHSL